MDVVADAGAVAGGQVGAGDRELRLDAARRHHELAEHVRGLLGVDAGGEAGVGADGVEVAQDDGAQVGGRGHVLQHLLHHVLGARVRRVGRQRVVLEDLEALLDVVERGRAGEDDARQVERHQLVEELQRLGHVVAVVLVGLLHRLRHHDPRRHVHGGLEVGVLVADAAQQRPVGDVALVEDPPRGEHPRPGEQAVEHHRRVPGLLERRRRRRAEVAGAAGHEDLHGVTVGAAAGCAGTVGWWSVWCMGRVRLMGFGSR